MFFKSNRLEEKKEGEELLREVVKDKKQTLVIHYSCESFGNLEGRSPRINSINVRNLGTASTKTFSIHLQAQFKKKDLQNLSDADYDELEKALLDEFYAYVKDKSGYKWVHWNMRDANFGFDAIANRYRILEGSNIPDIPENSRYDLSRVLNFIYSYNFESHEPDGRLLNLARRNHITLKDALKGFDEAEAFDKKDYLKLHKSALRKVDVISDIVELAVKKRLKVATNKIALYGLSVPGIIEIIKNNWLLNAMAYIIVYVLGIWSQPLINSIF